MTKTDEIIALLGKMGANEVDCRSGKYRQFKHPHDRMPGFSFFVGKRAAIRRGTCASNSVSITYERLGVLLEHCHRRELSK